MILHYSNPNSFYHYRWLRACDRWLFAFTFVMIHVLACHLSTEPDKLLVTAVTFLLVVFAPFVGWMIYNLILGILDALDGIWEWLKGR